MLGDAGPSDGASADGTITDAPHHDAMVPPDAYVWCPTLGTSCIDELNLETCETVGHIPTYTQCNAGCVAAAPAHCGVIVPTGVVTTTDLAEDPTLVAITISTPTSVNTDTGEIAGVRGPGAGVIAGIDFEVRSGVGVFRFANLTTTAKVTFTGTNAVAVASLDTIQANAELNVQGDCVGNHAGPGGTPGSVAGSGAGGDGMEAMGAYPGGGGGGNGAAGGIGGHTIVSGVDTPGGAAGPSFGDPAISVLRGGGGGGAGAGPSGGAGGGGGGAIQLVARNEIVFSGTSASPAGVFANGCGGKHGSDAGGGGGGGAGGAILMEAPYIDTGFDWVSHSVVGGGGGSHTYTGLSTEDGNGDYASRGGIPGGGDGGTREYNGRTLAGTGGGGGGTRGGGGGGGVGRIRFNYVSGIRIPNGGDTVPNTGDAVTTATMGSASVE